MLGTVASCDARILLPILRAKESPGPFAEAAVKQRTLLYAREGNIQPETRGQKRFTVVHNMYERHFTSCVKSLASSCLLGKYTLSFLNHSRNACPLFRKRPQSSALFCMINLAVPRVHAFPVNVVSFLLLSWFFCFHRLCQHNDNTGRPRHDLSY